MSANTMKATAADLFGLLASPKTTLELRAALRHSPQAIDQALKRLMRKGFVRRVQIFGEAARHLYLRSEHELAKAVASRITRLRPTDKRVLCAIEEGLSYAAVDVAHTIGIAPSRAERRVSNLIRLRLIEARRVGRRFVLRITKKGMGHPQYRPAAPKAPAYDPAKHMSRRRREVLLLLRVLKRATTFEITLITGLRKRRRGASGIANVIQGLKEAGYIEKVRGMRQAQPPYRLSKYGREQVELLIRQIGMPVATEVQSRLKQERDRFHREQSRRAKRRAAQRSGRKGLSAQAADVVAVLQRYGPTPTEVINKLLPHPYRNPRSVDTTLRRLASRRHAVIIEPPVPGKRRSNVWGIRATKGDSDPLKKPIYGNTRARHNPKPAAGLPKKVD